MTEPKKVCANPDCHRTGHRQPWSNFYAKTKWEDGTTRQPQARCKDCHREATKAWHREKWSNDPEWRKRRKAEEYASLVADPERYATHLDRKREWARERYGCRIPRPRANRYSRPGLTAAGGDFLEPQPFASWLRSLPYNHLELATALGVDEAVIRRWRKGEDRVRLDNVDRVCLAFGVSIDAVYGEAEAA